MTVFLVSFLLILLFFLLMSPLYPLNYKKQAFYKVISCWFRIFLVNLHACK